MVFQSTVFAGVAAVVMLAAAAPAHAQVWSGSRSPHADARYDPNDFQRQAYDNGYRRGLDRGEDDARDRRPMNHRDESDYRNADWGYNSKYGSRDDYRQSFRSGFEVGYHAGYDKVGTHSGRPVPRPPVYGNTYPDPGYGRYPNGRYGHGYAADAGRGNGYRDGFDKGQKDWRGHKSYDVMRHDWYRDGDRHYKKEYGRKDDYRSGYRAGFERGYREAFGGGRYY